MAKKSRKKVKTQNIIQLLVALFVVVLINYMGSFYFMRLDLTAEKRFTLNETSKNLLQKLDDVVFVKIYLEGDDLPIGFKRLQTAVEEMLDELSVYAGNNLQYQFVNPFEKAETSKAQQKITRELAMRGIEPTDLQERTKDGKVSKKRIFPGCIISYKGRETAVNLLKNTRGLVAEQNLNNSIQSLEYELTNGIRKLTRTNPPKIAFIQGHGELPEPFIRDFAVSLAEHYHVEQAFIGGETDSLFKYTTLIFAKPQNEFSEKDKFAIDQFVMQGGKVLWLIDGVKADMDSIFMGSMLAMHNNLGITDQLFKYGVRINPVLIQDMRCASIGVNVAMPGEQPKIESMPWLYYPLIVSRNNHPVTKYLNVILTPFVSSIDTVGENPLVSKTILLQTSEYAKQIGFNVPQTIDLEFTAPNENEFRNGNIPIAVLLEGRFESVFQNRNSHPFVRERGNRFKEISEETKMIVVACGDIIRNEISRDGELQPIGYNRYTRQFYPGNKEFLTNAVNYLCDDEGLMSIRNREIKLRLLDKKKVSEQYTFWQLLNTLAPVLLVVIFGLIINIYRRRKYAK